MSAFRWLAFVVGIAVLAAVASIATEFVLPTIEVARSQSSTAASSQGIAWYATIWEWIPLILMILLMFSLLVGIIVRRRRTLP